MGCCRIERLAQLPEPAVAHCRLGGCIGVVGNPGDQQHSAEDGASCSLRGRGIPDLAGREVRTGAEPDGRGPGLDALSGAEVMRLSPFPLNGSGIAGTGSGYPW